MSESLKGKFLIAGYQLRDPNFFKTAVLIIEHTAEGAMGLVVNRPTSVTVANALAGHFELPESNDLVYGGGPVEPAALFIMHDCPEFDPGESPVTEGLYVASSAEAFESVIRAVSSDEPVRCRIFMGCAGWGAGQLEGELARGDWMIHDASDEFVFHEDAYCVWEDLVNAVYAKHRLVPHPVVSPELN
jgi:putative transcriptional regulator